MALKLQLAAESLQELVKAPQPQPLGEARICISNKLLHMMLMLLTQVPHFDYHCQRDQRAAGNVLPKVSQLVENRSRI